MSSRFRLANFRMKLTGPDHRAAMVEGRPPLSGSLW
jgi:hypothetical protein